MAPDQLAAHAAGQPTEVWDAVGHEYEDPAGAEGIARLDVGQGRQELALVRELGRAGKLQRDEAREHRPEAHDDAVDGLRWRDEGPDVELDVGKRGWGGLHQALRGKGEQLHEPLAR